LSYAGSASSSFIIKQFGYPMQYLFYPLVMVL